MSQYFDPNGPMQVPGMGQRYDPALELQKLRDHFSALIMGKQSERPRQDIGRRIDPVMQTIEANFSQPTPQTAVEGALQGMASIVRGARARQDAMGPFPDMPAGGQRSPLTGLANMFGFSRGGLY